MVQLYQLSLQKHEEGKISRNKGVLSFTLASKKQTAKLVMYSGVDQSRVNELYGTDDQTYELKINMIKNY